MKKWLWILVLGVFTMQSCKDECKDVQCENGGGCNNGSCVCVDGYEGDVCQEAMNAKFEGTYDLLCNGSLGIAIPIPIPGVPSELPIVDMPGEGNIDLGNGNKELVFSTEIIGNQISMTGEADGTTFELNTENFTFQGFSVSVSGDGSLVGNTLTINLTVSGVASGTIVCVGDKI